MTTWKPGTDLEKIPMLELISDYWQKKNKETYTKSQDMKRFIIDRIILQLNKDLNKFITLHCVSNYDRK